MPTPHAIQLRRHYRLATEKETQELVEAMAELFVNFIKGQDAPDSPGAPGRERDHERDHEPDAGAR